MCTLPRYPWRYKIFSVSASYPSFLAKSITDVDVSPLTSSGDTSKTQAQTFALPYSARRWLPANTSPVPPHSPSLANTTAYIRIIHSGAPNRTPGKDRVARILDVAGQYKDQSSKAMDSPTPESVLASKSLVPLLIKGVEKADPLKYVLP